MSSHLIAIHLKTKLILFMFSINLDKLTGCELAWNKRQLGSVCIWPQSEANMNLSFEDLKTMTLLCPITTSTCRIYYANLLYKAYISYTASITRRKQPDNEYLRLRQKWTVAINRSFLFMPDTEYGALCQSVKNQSK